MGVWSSRDTNSRFGPKEHAGLHTGRWRVDATLVTQLASLVVWVAWLVFSAKLARQGCWPLVHKTGTSVSCVRYAHSSISDMQMVLRQILELLDVLDARVNLSKSNVRQSGDNLTILVWVLPAQNIKLAG